MRLSVVVPVGPGDESWRSLLPDLAPLPAGDAEILLVAATGSRPAGFDPADFGLRAETRWLEAPAGRATQQNAGAASARGDLLWFVHADSRLPAATLAAALQFAAGHALGYCELRFRADGPVLVRLNAWGAHWRSRLFRLPFGDQGLLLPRAVFESLGGFDPAVVVGEDHALVAAARRAGVPVVPLGATIETSARRYAEHGWLRTTARHWALTLAQAWSLARAGHRAQPGAAAGPGAGEGAATRETRR